MPTLLVVVVLALAGCAPDGRLEQMEAAWREAKTQSAAALALAQNEAGEGGSEDNVKGDFDLPVSKGVSSKGDWPLKITDSEAQDVGKLNAWSLKITP